MEIHHLKIFTSVFRNRSFTRASEELGISQPTISEHIKNLEVSIGRPLFDRLGRTILPTNDAEVLFPRALQILADVEQLKDDLAGNAEEVSGKLRIGASTVPGAYILPQELHTFRAENPGVAFEIIIEDSARITEMVANHELLCGLVGAKMEPEKLYHHAISDDELVLVAAPGILRSKSISLKKLYEIPFIFREKGSGTRERTLEFLEHAGVDVARLNIVAVLGSSAAVKEALKAGLGVSILSKLAVREALRNKVLRQISIPGLNLHREFFLIHHRRRTLSKSYQAFCDYLIRRAVAADFPGL